MSIFPKIWELVERFKLRCNKKGWKVCEGEDLVDVKGEYHHFIWMRRIYPKTFRKVITYPYVSIREGSSYRLVNVSYTAWLSPEPIVEKLLDAFLEDPELSRKVAVYDISPVYKGERICLKMNETNSIVFQEFERFLNEKYQIHFKPVYEALQPSKNVYPSQP